MFAFRVAHCVAVIVPAAATVVNAGCPYVVFIVALILAPTVVDTKPL
jgi:hypothetical protein